jgi:hypothetical protein
VRTPEFKQWFGDWEKAANAEELLARPSAQVVPAAPMSKVDAEVFFASLTGIVSPDGFKTSFPKTTVQKIRKHRGFDVTTIIKDLRILFEKAIFIGEESSKGAYTDVDGRLHKGKPNIDSYKNYVNKGSCLAE